MVWSQTLRCEAGIYSGRVSGGFLWDLESFYDTIDLDLLLERAEKAGFPMIIARMAISTYTAPRSVQTRAGRGAPLFPRRGVAAGCSLAKALVHLYYLGPMDKFREKHKDIMFDIYVDDL